MRLAAAFRRGEGGTPTARGTLLPDSLARRNDTRAVRGNHTQKNDRSSVGETQFGTGKAELRSSSAARHRYASFFCSTTNSVKVRVLGAPKYASKHDDKVLGLIILTAVFVRWVLRTDLP